MLRAIIENKTIPINSRQNAIYFRAVFNFTSTTNNITLIHRHHHHKTTPLNHKQQYFPLHSLYSICYTTNTHSLALALHFIHRLEFLHKTQWYHSLVFVPRSPRKCTQTPLRALRSSHSGSESTRVGRAIEGGERQRKGRKKKQKAKMKVQPSQRHVQSSTDRQLGQSHVSHKVALHFGSGYCWP